MKVEDILAAVGELGFFEINTDGSIYITPPAINVHKSRLELLGKILFDYKKCNPKASCKGFFTLYDAWREHSEPSDKPRFVTLGKKCLKLFVGKGTLGEPGRFIQPFFLKDTFPVFQYPVFSFGRHKNDPFVQLLPDTDFVSTSGYRDLRTEIGDSDCPWDKKIPKLYWRGSKHGFPYKQYDQMQLRSQRELLLDWAVLHDDFCDVALSKISSKAEQLQYKFLLDIDGEVNAWSAYFWKLLSSSVVFKVNSHYEQWYYHRLEPWKHYIPVAADLSDLLGKFNWAIENDDACCKIAQAGRQFALQMTYERELAHLRLSDDVRQLFASQSVIKANNFVIPRKPGLTVEHTYQPTSSSVQQPPGFGDFLRGSISLYQLSVKYGFNLSLDFRSHPLGCLINRNNEDSLFVNLPIYEFFNQKNCALESFLVGQSEPCKLRLTTHAVPLSPVNRECRRFILRHIKPIDEISSYVSSILNRLELKEFATVHIRMGDHQFENELDLPTALEKYFVEKIIPIWSDNVLVVSDNTSIKETLKRRFGVKIVDVKPVHLGESALRGATSNEVRDTFAEFLLMAKSDWIFQYSVYPWGSSFSEICARLYDIPFERLHQ